jgi:hypothetical protein
VIHLKRANKIKKSNRFLDIKALAATSPSEMVAQCHRLLQEPELDSAVRVGDVYGLMIECVFVFPGFCSSNTKPGFPFSPGNWHRKNSTSRRTA